MKQKKKLVKEKCFLTSVDYSRADIMNIYDLQNKYLHEMNSKINDMR